MKNIELKDLNADWEKINKTIKNIALENIVVSKNKKNKMVTMKYGNKQQKKCVRLGCKYNIYLCIEKENL